MLRIESDGKKIRAAITLPGSKSISNRFLLLKEVLQSDTTAENLSSASDTKLLAQALEMINGSSSAAIDIGQAGTDMRFLTAYLAATPGEWILTGSERMKNRPVAELVQALRSMGADIHYAETEGYPPLRIRGKQLHGGKVSIRSNVSSQFVSALLLIAPLLTQPLTLHLKGKIVSKPYISMTLGLLRIFGYRSQDEGATIAVFPRKRKKPVRKLMIESDWSSASYYYSICALAPDAAFELKYLKKKSLQADARTARVFRKLGVTTVYRADSVLISRNPARPKTFVYNFSDCPDIAQTVAVVCFGLGIKARLAGLETLRLKETDRIAALQTELTKLGAKVETGHDELCIKGALSDTARDTIIETYGDHRMAMSFAPLALKLKTLRIRDPEVTDKSYPAFWEDLKSLGFSLNLQP